MIYVLVKESTYNNHDDYECLYSSFDRNKVESIRIQKIELHKKHVIAYEKYQAAYNNFHKLYSNYNMKMEMKNLGEEDLFTRTVITFTKGNHHSFKDETGEDFVGFTSDCEFKIVEVEFG